MEKIRKLRRKAKGHKIWFSVNEATDIDRRYIACFVFGILGVKGEEDKNYLLHAELMDKVNHSTIAAFCNNSLYNVLIACTDAAAYMVKGLTDCR